MGDWGHATVREHLGLKWRPLHGEWSQETSGVFGNKGATLMRLSQIGFQVPPGISVSSASLAATLVDTFVDDLPPVDTGPWAVRSSSLSEDGMSRAFPGIFKTVLGVSDPNLLAGALLEVGTPPGADILRTYSNDALDVDRIPAIIQTIPHPTSSGVLFTRDPISLDDSVVINSSWGLGRTVVDGLITPDEFRVRPSGQVERAISSSKSEATDQFGRSLPLDPARWGEPSLSNDQASEIAALGRDIERALGSPQDIEWLLDANGAFWIVQARPITTPVSLL